MTTALTENQADADFSTGLAVPSNGTDSALWGPEVVSAFQELADRTQRLRLWLPDAPPIHVPMQGLVSGLSNFTQTTATNRTIYSQSSVAAAGSVYFLLPPLPTGRKITAVAARWQNTGTVTLPTGVMPVVRLYRQSVVLGGDWAATASVLVGSQADTTATVGAYKLNHDITLSGLSETISDDNDYLIKFEGEGAGANSVIGGNLMALRLTLGL
jgi:hypothetical protein